MNLYRAQEKLRTERGKKRSEKAKGLGTYESGATRKRRREGGRRVVDRDYLRWVHGFLCCVPCCQTSWPVHAHHATLKSQLGSDRDVIPLCPRHHIGEFHGQLGSAEAAEEAWGISFAQVISKLQGLYETGKKGPMDTALSDEDYKAS